MRSLTAALILTLALSTIGCGRHRTVVVRSTAHGPRVVAVAHKHRHGCGHHWNGHAWVVIRHKR